MIKFLSSKQLLLLCQVHTSFCFKSDYWKMNTNSFPKNNSNSRPFKSTLWAHFVYQHNFLLFIFPAAGAEKASLGRSGKLGTKALPQFTPLHHLDQLQVSLPHRTQCLEDSVSCKQIKYAKK